MTQITSLSVTKTKTFQKFPNFYSGPLNPDLYSKICETKLSASDSMMIVTARQIAGHDSDAAGGKKKKKRGIGGKNKKLAAKKLANEGMPQSQNAAVQMEIF